MRYIRGYLTSLQDTLDSLPVADIDEVIALLRRARLEHRKIFILGNGGSASTASHFVCDLAKNTRVRGWPDFRVIGLADNMPLVTAFANDEGYESIFATQLANLVEEGDVVIGISTSGNSENVLNAIRVGRGRGAVTVGFTGFDGGQLGPLSDLHLHVPSDCIEHVEDAHLVLEHLITKRLREEAEESAPPFLLGDEKQWPVVEGADQAPTITINGAEIMAALGREIVANRDRVELLSRILRLSIDSIGAASGSVIVLDGAGQIVDAIVDYQGQIRHGEAEGLADTLREGLAGWVVRERAGALIESTAGDPRWLQREWEREENPPRSAMSVPLIVDLQVVGVLTAVLHGGGRFTEVHFAILTAIATFLSMRGGDVLGGLSKNVSVVDAQVDSPVRAGSK